MPAFRQHRPPITTTSSGVSSPLGPVFLHATEEGVRSELSHTDATFQLAADGNVKAIHERLEFFTKEAIHAMRDGAGWSLLHYSVFFGHLPVVEYLCRTWEMDVNIACHMRTLGVTDWRPLHMACEMRDPNMVHLLLQLGACPYLMAKRDKKAKAPSRSWQPKSQTNSSTQPSAPPATTTTTTAAAATTTNTERLQQPSASHSRSIPPSENGERSASLEHNSSSSSSDSEGNDDGEEGDVTGRRHPAAATVTASSSSQTEVLDPSRNSASAPPPPASSSVATSSSGSEDEGEEEGAGGGDSDTSSATSSAASTTSSEAELTPESGDGVSSLTSSGVEQWNALHLAVLSSDLSIIRVLCQQHWPLVNYRQPHSRKTPLMLAVKRRSMEIVTFLLENGARVNDKALPRGRTALFFAVKYTCAQIVDLLIDHGAELTVRLNLRKSFLASSFSKTLLVNPSSTAHTFSGVLIAPQHTLQLVGPNVPQTVSSSTIPDPPQGPTLLHELLLDCAPTEMQDALHIIQKLCQLAPQLLEVGCDGELNCRGLTVFAVAMMRFDKFPELAHVLLACGANVNCAICMAPNSRMNLLHYVIENHVSHWALKAATFLLENGIDVNCLDEQGQSPLMRATSKNMLQVVKKIVAKNPNPDFVDGSGASALMLGVKQQRVSIVRELLSHLSPNLELGITFTDSRGNQYSGCTPLHMAVGKGSITLTTLLLQHGANLYATMEAIGPDQEPCTLTCVHTAVVMDHLEMCQFLLDKGLKQDASEYGLTPLAFAASWGHYDIAKLLIQRGADVNAVGSVSGDPPIIFAIKRDKHRIIELLLENGANPNIQNAQGFTALHYGLNYNHGKSLRLLFQWHDEQVNKQKANEEKSNTKSTEKVGLNVHAVSRQVDHRANVTPLVLGLEYANPLVIKRLLDMGSDPNAVFTANGVTLTPILLCAEFDSIKNFEHLVSYGADIDAQSSRGETALHVALRFRCPLVAQRLISYGARLDIRAKAGNGEQMQAIHMAAQTGQTRLVQMLTRYGAHLNSCMVLKGTERVTPLHVAALNDHTQTVKSLIDLGAEVNCKRSDSFTPILTLVSKSNKDAVQYLLVHGADANCRCVVSRSKDATCLHIAAQVGDLQVVQLLLKHGADPMACMVTGDRTGILPMHLAAESGHIGIVRHFIEQVHVPPNVSEDCGLTCLHYAANTGKAELVHYLIQKGASLTMSAAFEDGSRQYMLPIHMAAEKGHEKALQILIQHGSPLNAVITRSNREKITALYLAVSENKPACVRLLVDAGADINAPDSIGAAPLHIATQRGYEDIFEILVSSGRADVNIATHMGVTPLHMVAEKGFLEMAFWLLRSGAQVDPECQIVDIHSKKMSYHITPLNQACGFGHVHIVKLLLKYGADPYHGECFEGEEGVSAIHCAAIRGRSAALAELVKSAHVTLSVRDAKGRTPLHWCVHECFYECCQTLLQHGADPTLVDSFGKTPLMYATNSALRGLLVQAEKKWLQIHHPLQDHSLNMMTSDKGHQSGGEEE